MSSPLFLQIVSALFLQGGNVTLKVLSNEIGIEVTQRVEKIVDMVRAHLLNARERLQKAWRAGFVCFLTKFKIGIAPTFP